MMNESDTPRDPTEESLPLQELRRRLREGRVSPQGFRHLARALVAGDEEARAQEAEMDCQGCDEILDLYVDDHLQGRDVETLYPAVWRHLRICTRCRESYEAVVDVLRAERNGELPQVPEPAVPTLSFLEPDDSDVPWTAHLRSRLDGVSFGLSLTLNVSHLQRLFFQASPLPTRADEDLAPSRTFLLLSDTVDIDGQRVAVEVTGERTAERPEHVYVRANVAGPVPAALTATLYWTDRSSTSRVTPDGKADFGEVPLTALETGEGKVRIVFRKT